MFGITQSCTKVWNYLSQHQSPQATAISAFDPTAQYSHYKSQEPLSSSIFAFNIAFMSHLLLLNHSVQ